MALNRLAIVLLVTLLFNAVSNMKSGVNWRHSTESLVDIYEFENGTVEDACDTPSSSLSTVPACSLTWTYCDNGTCVCAGTDKVLCLPSGQVFVHGGYCVTYDDTRALTQLGKCLYKDRHSMILLQYSSVPSNVSELDEYKCGPLNRTGMLCGKCKDGYYPLVNSLDMNCVKCPNGWSNLWRFVMVAFIPLTVFYFIILLFRVNATSSQLHGFIYCCQGIALAPLLRAELLVFSRSKRNSEMAVRTIGTLYGIWNLDFLRSVDLGICLPIDTLTALALDAAVGVYPLLLILITYVMIFLYDRNFTPLVAVWKPFTTLVGLLRSSWDIKTSLIDAFITFLYLSSVKFMSVSFDLLAPVLVKQLDSVGNMTESWHVYYDPTVPYFHVKHIPYAVLALCVLTLFVILPALLLLFYPFACFQKVLNTLPIRQHVLHTFMDSFLGCYKDGTQPDTRDCRWFASLLFCFRFLLLIIGIFIQDATFYVFAAIVVVSCVILMTLVQPFKKGSKHLYTNTLFMLLLALLYTLSLQITAQSKQPRYYIHVFIVLTTVVAVLPLLYLSALIVHWLYSHRRFGGQLLRTVQAWRHGYQTLD